MKRKLAKAAWIGAIGIAMIIAGLIAAYIWQPDIPEFVRPATSLQYRLWYLAIIGTCVLPGALVLCSAMAWWISLRIVQNTRDSLASELPGSASDSI